MAAAIDEEFERSARLRKILPAEVSMPGAYGVVVPRVGTPQDHALSIDTTDLAKPITASVELRIDARHFDDLDSILMLVRAAANRIAVAEDRIIAFGGCLARSVAGGYLGDVRVQGLDASTHALFFPGTGATVVHGQDPTTAGGLLAQIATAVAGLQAPADKRPYLGPFACVIGPSAWTVCANSTQSIEILRATLGSSWIAPVGPNPSPKELPSFAVFGHEALACDLVCVREPGGSCRGFAADGSLRYFVETQFLLRVKDAEAFSCAWKSKSP